MKQDPQFTAKLQQWMNTPDPQKDWAEGAVLLLQLSGNQIMYRNISMNPKGKAEFIKGQLQKYLNFRLQQLTHNEVLQMQAQVDEIVKNTIKPFAIQTNPSSVGTDGTGSSAQGEHPSVGANNISPAHSNPSSSVGAHAMSEAEKNQSKSEEFADFKAGKRTDHDLLPAEVQALYVENLDIVHHMRELHLKLRTLSLDNATCPDSDRYPFLKEIIALDKRLHDNWDTYDHFVIQEPPAPVDETTENELKEESPNTSNDNIQAVVQKEVTESEVVEDKPKKTAGRKPKSTTAKKASKKD